MVLRVQPYCKWSSGTLAAARIRNQGKALSAVDAPPEPHLRSKRNQTQNYRLMSLTLAVEPLALAQVLDLLASALA